MKHCNLLLTLSILFLSLSLFAQKGTIQGTVTDAITEEPLYSVTIRVGSVGTITDFEGQYSLALQPGAYDLEFSYVGYATQTLKVNIKAGETQTLDLKLTEEATILQTATVTSGKFEKSLGEVTVSLEVLKPQLIESVNTVSVDQVLEKVPGVNIIDGQANIRGGSGFSYGAGSRVLLLVDDVPMLQADAGFPNWNDLPVENIEQIEVVKGAASALYGSSALNGIINVRTSFAKSKPEFKASLFHGIYGGPKDATKKWYKNVPYSTGGSMTYKRRLGRLDVVMSGFALKEQSYLERNFLDYQRLTVGLRYRPTENLNIGLNSNFNGGQSQSFFFWLNPADGALKGTRSAYSATRRLRFNVDPYITYFDPGGNRHKLLGRYYSVDNNSLNSQSNASQLYYGEYQFQRQFAGIQLVTSAGVVVSGTNVQAELYGDTIYRSFNLAGYLQLDQKLFDRLNLSAGFRYESNRLDNPGYSFFDGIKMVVIPASNESESKPVFRFGANLEIAEFTFLRASWGQGYRYPTIAEKYITTTFGGVPISPNPELQSETGWSTELGLKQGFRVFGFEGFLDLAAFWSEYDNMMEFTFVDIFPTGFQSQNVGGTKIYGAELTVAGRGKFLGMPSNLLTGFTWIEPQFSQFDTTPVGPNETPTEGQKNALNSSVDYNVLKYRNRKTFKFDLESSYKKWSFGVAVLAASSMENIDKVFELLVVPGLQQYRAENGSDYVNTGIRAGYKIKEKAKVSFLIDNLFNTEYTVRPGLIEPPRSFTLRLDCGL
ncbi:MAG: TonB-dependent receptor [Lewinellaceae bacterium]|nr:TonB-dependent receptor [Lewinellaceae bacterium]